MSNSDLADLGNVSRSWRVEVLSSLAEATTATVTAEFAASESYAAAAFTFADSASAPSRPPLLPPPPPVTRLLLPEMMAETVRRGLGCRRGCGRPDREDALSSSDPSGTASPPVVPPASRGGGGTTTANATAAGGQFCLSWFDPSGIRVTGVPVGRGGGRVGRDENGRDDDNGDSSSMSSSSSSSWLSSSSSFTSTSDEEEEEDGISGADHLPGPGRIGFGLDDGGGRNVCRRSSSHDVGVCE